MLSHSTDRGCVYLDGNDPIHRQIATELDNSILVMDMCDGLNGAGSMLTVQIFLANVFGGHTFHYRYLKYTRTSFIVLLPQGLDKIQVVNMGNQWGEIANWKFQPWSADEEANYQPKRFRVRLHITDFPLDFWSPKFIKQVMSCCGEVKHIDEGYVARNDRTCLKIWIHCIDPRRIPPVIDIAYSNRFKTCAIQVIRWEYNDTFPDEATYTVREQRALGTQFRNDPNLPRYSLLAAHDKLLNYYARDGYTSSPDSTASESTMPTHLAASYTHHTTATEDPTVRTASIPPINEPPFSSFTNLGLSSCADARPPHSPGRNFLSVPHNQ
ncbi:hypothetical protein FCM35_KLT15851 [Carex littledalei]|uniref:DUF4283 domain-containing protein n=1 Tax=Carex littledalei TaxID=544730 RepID=A0A833VSD9_9POAL|nr:hypothetical protein FCM35_KLT15851 [Carex littledalei]